MVNTCGHKICERCVDAVFVRGTGSCPICGKALKRNKFRTQFFEDSSVDREVQIRKQLAKEFNLGEEDFGSLREFNDYQEMIETYVFNVTENLDTTEVIAQMKKFKEDFKSKLEAKKHVLPKSIQELDVLIAENETERLKHENETAMEEMNAKRLRARRNETMLDDLTATTLPAATVVAAHLALRENTRNVPSYRLKSADTVVKAEEIIADEPYVYKPKPENIGSMGPQAPDWEELHEKGFMEFMRAPTDYEVAAGFLTEWAARRALSEGYDGLFYNLAL